MKIKERIFGSARNFAVFCLKAFIVLFLVMGLFLFFSQDKFKRSTAGSYISRLVGNFVQRVSNDGPVGAVRSWIDVDAGGAKINTREELTEYKLNLLAKALNNYFKDLLISTEKILSDSELAAAFSGNSQLQSEAVQSRMKQVLGANPDLLEFSLYSERGEKITGIKYRNSGEYQFSPKLLSILKKNDNILIKQANSRNLVLLSAVRFNGKFKGAVTQTLNPVFFTRILDFLNIHDNLFYLKNPQDELVLDNWKAYEFINNKKHSIPHMFYRKLTRSHETSLGLNIDSVNYSLGVVIEENNMLGDILSLLFVLFLLYAGVMSVNVLGSNFARIGEISGFRKKSGSNLNAMPEHFTGNSADFKPESSAPISADAIFKRRR